MSRAKARTGRGLLVVAVVAFALAGALAGCGSSDEPSAGDALEAELRDRTFVSQSVTENDAPRPMVEGTKITLHFGEELEASAGCNTFFGAFSIDDARVLVVDDLGGTEMGCGRARQAQDEWLVELLTSRPSIALADGDHLTVATDTTTVELLDREVADPDRPLTGRTWRLDTLVDGGTASSVPQKVDASIRFADDGTFELQTACNSAGGSYAVDADTITITDFRTTLIACTGAAGRVEAAITAVLDRGDVSYAIDAARLTLTAGNHGLGFVTE